ncbi:patatin-like phospholipase family protein [Aestuariibacter sp. AA17]|uniref:Patatin-like phospholipase family protein n=1 Tax=Fluctibacter corallii TaxID=2984329 RepID=A0ABT3A8T1_9ALTE|nr:patatin-like phospholipase family protein [Aestuariibacter sp. AA17]MCV2885020.1 patatin-like phospholipase family protein [Aestuariibacter sp. AA17]
MIQRQHYGLMLSGGGARAAYQVGVLKAITHFLPRNHSIPFPIICGNSAGAINATSLACYASCYHLGIRKLEWVWKHFRTHHVYGANVKDVFGYMLRNYTSRFRSHHVQKRPTSLLNNAPLRQLIKNYLDFKRIDHNIMSGNLRAVSVLASSYTSYDSIAYFQARDDIQPWRRAQRRGLKCTLDVEHLMASSAIPLVFPTVKIDGEFLGDGAIHLHSPLSAPIHLGAEKILVIGVEQPEQSNRFINAMYYPTAASIAGHLLDTIFADTLHSDLERLERVNQTLKIMTPEQRKHIGLKPIECLIINPSLGFNTLASRYFHLLPKGIRALLSLIGATQKADSTLLSYLLFEKEFCADLIELGYRDGLRRQDEIRAFLNI